MTEQSLKFKIYYYGFFTKWSSALAKYPWATISPLTMWENKLREMLKTVVDDSDDPWIDTDYFCDYVPFYSEFCEEKLATMDPETAKKIRFLKKHMRRFYDDFMNSPYGYTCVIYDDKQVYFMARHQEDHRVYSLISMCEDLESKLQNMRENIPKPEKLGQHIDIWLKYLEKS